MKQILVYVSIYTAALKSICLLHSFLKTPTSAPRQVLLYSISPSQAYCGMPSLTNYLWRLLHNASLSDSSRLDSHRMIDALFYSLFILAIYSPPSDGLLDWKVNAMVKRTGIRAKKIAVHLIFDTHTRYRSIWILSPEVINNVQ